MNYQTAIKTCIMKKYAKFEGRASRSEYWYFILFYAIANILAGLLGGIASSSIVTLAFVLPSIAVGVRRLHDIDKSGWFMLMGGIPLINLVLIYFLIQKGTDGANRFGESVI